MQRNPEHNEPTTEPQAAGLEAEGLGEEQATDAAEDVQAHIWAGKPPIVDDFRDAG
jgi:hypothetical protein